MSEDAASFRPEEFSRYIASEAGSYARLRPNDREDFQQEGLIAAWKASESYDSDKGTAFKSWAIRSIDFALLQAYSRRKWTGMPDRTKQGGASSSGEQALLVGDWGPPDHEHSGPNFESNKNLQVEDHSERADWVYHQVEIMKALSELKPDQRRYVVLRFWCGYRGNELKAFFPNIKQPDVTLWHNPSGARAKLRQALSHLVSR